jgi:hypothetical protein
VSVIRGSTVIIIIIIIVKNTFLCVSRGDLIAGTESEVAAAQNQTLQTKCDATKILQTETNSKCRLRQQFDKTVDHIMSTCSIVAKEQYMYDQLVLFLLLLLLLLLVLTSIFVVNDVSRYARAPYIYRCSYN